MKPFRRFCVPSAPSLTVLDNSICPRSLLFCTRIWFLLIVHEVVKIGKLIRKIYVDLSFKLTKSHLLQIHEYVFKPRLLSQS